MEYDFYVRGPDDERFEQIPGGTETDFLYLLHRGASDNLYKACRPRSTPDSDPVMCERGHMEC